MHMERPKFGLNLWKFLNRGGLGAKMAKTHLDEKLKKHHSFMERSSGGEAAARVNKSERKGNLREREGEERDR